MPTKPDRSMDDNEPTPDSVDPAVRDSILRSRKTKAPPTNKAYAKGGKVRGDGCVTKGRTKGWYC